MWALGILNSCRQDKSDELAGYANARKQNCWWWCLGEYIGGIALSSKNICLQQILIFRSKTGSTLFNNLILMKRKNEFKDKSNLKTKHLQDWRTKLSTLSLDLINGFLAFISISVGQIDNFWWLPPDLNSVNAPLVGVNNKSFFRYR